jgi:hypothetical protein
VPFDISEVVSRSISNDGAIPKVEIEQEEEMDTSIVPLSYLNSCAHRPPSSIQQGSCSDFEG